MSRRHRSFLFAVALVMSTSACGVDEGDGPEDTPPEAPTDLMAAALEGGAHLTWEDNSDNETEFMIQRKLEADAKYTTIATVPFDTTQYHDAPLESGATYMYMVMAMNDHGESAAAELTFTAP